MNEIGMDDGRGDLLNHDRDSLKRAMGVINRGKLNLDENLNRMAQSLGIDLSIQKEDKDKQLKNDQKDVELDK